MRCLPRSEFLSARSRAARRCGGAVALILGLAAVLGACGSDGEVRSVESTSTTSVADGIDPASGGSTLNPVAGTWELQFAVLEGDMAIPIPDDSVPTIAISGTDIDVYFGCNSGGGTVTYDISGDAFSIDDLFQTEMGCGEVQMNIEGAVARVLTSATTYSASPGELTISDGAEYPSSLTFVQM